MNTSTKVAGFILGLAAVFALALGAGALAGPENTTPDTPGDEVATGTASPVTDGSLAGLTSTDAGYTFSLETADVDAGTQVPVHFRIKGPDGQPVTRYVESHDKQLHLIAVRRDLTEYAHVHPVLDDTGTWTVPLDLDEAGTYRLFADFTPDGGAPLTLGAELHVAGHFDPRPLPPTTATTTVDGYTVTLDGVLTPGQASTVTATVSRDGTRSPTCSPTSAPTDILWRCEPPTWVISTCTRTDTRVTGSLPPARVSTSRSRLPAPTTTDCSWTSDMTEWCGPPSSL